MQLPVYRTPSILDHLVQRKMSISNTSEKNVYNMGIVLLFIAVVAGNFVLWFNVYRAN